MSTYICHSERLLTNNKGKLQRNYNTTQASWTTATAIEQRQIKHTTIENWNGILTNDTEIPSTRASISAFARTTTKQRTNTPKTTPPPRTRKTYKKAKFSVNIQTELHEPKISKVNKLRTSYINNAYELHQPNNCKCRWTLL